MSEILAPRKYRQEDQKFMSIYWLHGSLRTAWDTGDCLKKIQTKRFKFWDSDFKMRMMVHNIVLYT